MKAWVGRFVQSMLVSSIGLKTGIRLPEANLPIASVGEISPSAALSMLRAAPFATRVRPKANGIFTKPSPHGIRMLLFLVKSCT